MSPKGRTCCVLRWPVEPMRAVGVAGLPDLSRPGMVAEPKWDGFRAVAWRSRDGVDLRSRHGRPLGPYFPDVCTVLAASLPPGVIVDGELVLWCTEQGRTSFVDLQHRLRAGRHLGQQAAARPAHLVCFDLLQDADGTHLLDRPLSTRRHRLEQLLASAPPQLVLCPQTSDEHTARRWFADLPATGIEGLVIKTLQGRYLPGRAGWQKVKHRRTVEMVIGGCTGTLTHPTALLLGRYDHHGRLRYLTQTHPLTPVQQRELAGLLTPTGPPGHAHHPWPAPLPATWSLTFADRQPLPYLQVQPTLVAEVELDTATGPAGRPRHLAHHVRVRADLLPDQLTPPDTHQWTP
jgi:ATP-dependent DNA ligase